MCISVLWAVFRCRVGARDWGHGTWGWVGARDWGHGTWGKFQVLIIIPRREIFETKLTYLRRPLKYGLPPIQHHKLVLPIYVGPSIAFPPPQKHPLPICGPSIAFLRISNSYNNIGSSVSLLKEGKLFIRYSFNNKKSMHNSFNPSARCFLLVNSMGMQLS